MNDRISNRKFLSELEKENMKGNTELIKHFAMVFAFAFVVLFSLFSMGMGVWAVYVFTNMFLHQFIAIGFASVVGLSMFITIVKTLDKSDVIEDAPSLSKYSLKVFGITFLVLMILFGLALTVWVVHFLLTLVPFTWFSDFLIYSISMLYAFGLSIAAGSAITERWENFN